MCVFFWLSILQSLRRFWHHTANDIVTNDTLSLELCFLSSSGIAAHDAARYKQKTSSVLLVGLYLFFCIVISNLFSSEMRASLTVQERSPTIRSWFDLTATFKKTKVLVWEYTIPHHTLLVT